VVEGHLLALRSEISNSQYYFPRYLLLSTAGSRLRRAIEHDIGFVANQLTYLEFTIGLEAKNTSTDMDSLSARSSLWGGTFDRIADVTGDAADLLISVGRHHATAINQRLGSFYVILRRLETFIESASSELDDVERRFASYIDSTDDFMRRQFTASEVPNISAQGLREALLNAYPYHYMKDPFSALQTIMRRLNNSVQHSGSIVSAILERSDHQANEALARVGRWLGALVTVLALVLALLQVVGSTSHSSRFIDQFLPWLSPATPVLFALLGGLFVASSLFYGVRWLLEYLPKRRHRFVRHVQRFRAMIAAASSIRAEALSTISSAGKKSDVWRDCDLLDDQASEVLTALWSMLHHARDEMSTKSKGYRHTWRGMLVRTPKVHDWAMRTVTLEYTIELFDLMPGKIMLPRTVCTLRFKSTDFYRRSTISKEDFQASLRAVGFSAPDITSLEFWLSTPENQQLIRQWSVPTLTRKLKQFGVSANPVDRNPLLWQGPLDAQL
jgi:hypothetical protein